MKIFIKKITLNIYGLTKLGAVYVNSLKDYEQAEQYFKESLKLAYKIGYRKGIVETEGELANLYHIQGKYTQAEELALHSLLLAEESENLQASLSNLQLNFVKAFP